MARFLREDAQFANLTASDIPAGATPSFTQTASLPVNIKAPQNQSIRIWERVPFAIAFTRLSGRTATGSCDIAVKINTTAIGNFTQGTNTTGFTTTAGGSNTAVAGDAIVVTISGVTSPGDLSFSLDYTWTLQ